jgi:hypothetical protein
MLVKHHSEEGNYVLQDLITQEVRDYHVSRLRPYLYDERTLTPLSVAVTDTLDEFVIEKVIRMRGDPRGKRTDLSFLVRWAGSLGEEDDTWEPWPYCKDSEAVQSYMRQHPNKRVSKLAKPIIAVEQPVNNDANESDTSDDDEP